MHRASKLKRFERTHFQHSRANKAPSARPPCLASTVHCKAYSGSSTSFALLDLSIFLMGGEKPVGHDRCLDGLPLSLKPVSYSKIDIIIIDVTTAQMRGPVLLVRLAVAGLTTASSTVGPRGPIARRSVALSAPTSAFCGFLMLIERRRENNSEGIKSVREAPLVRSS